MNSCLRQNILDCTVSLSSSSTVSVTFLFTSSVSSVALYKQVQKKTYFSEREKKIIIEVYGEETNLLERPWIRRSTVKRLRSLYSVADAVSGAGRGSARYQNFLATIHLQNLTFKDGLGRHHRLQIDNDLRSALKSENLKFPNSFCATSQHLLSEKTTNRPLYAVYFG